MGIKNLKVILNQKCKTAINIRKLDSYRGMILGIDISIFLYKYLYSNDDHLEGLTRLILRLLKNHITPLFIFDGKPPKEKNDILQNRKEKKDFMTIKKNIIEKCVDFDRSELKNFKESIIQYINNTNSDFTMNDDEIKELYEKDKETLEKDCEKLIKKIIYVTSYHIESSKNLFDLFGIKYIHAPCEAEALLAMLCKKNIINGCISEDTDVLPNGGQLFLRNFNADKNTIEEYCLYGILDNLNLTNDKFIDLCILCGCDYTAKIYGMGPITAYKLITKYDNIENILENNKKFIIPDNFNYEKARSLFKNPIDDDIFNNIDKNTKMNKPNMNDLISFLKKTSLKDKFFKEINDHLMNYYLNINGPNEISINKKITDFFN